MFPSTARRRPAGSRRFQAFATGMLPVAIALLVSIAPHRSAWPASHLVFASATSTATAVHDAEASIAANGIGAGGPLLPRESGLAVMADPHGPPEAQAATATPDAVQVTSAVSYYDVEGADVRSLLASLRQRGPGDGHGTWAASTSWVFRWSYQPILDPTCRVQAARVSLDLTYVYPQWKAPANVAPSLATAWQGYLARVELHEHGHRDIAEAAANDLARALEALPAQPTCEALAETARATAAELLARHAQAQIAYDRETGHGATQGAVLGQ